MRRTSETAMTTGIRVFITRYSGRTAKGRVATSPTADCRPTSGRSVEGHYEVKVNGAWISVPQTKIISRSAPRRGLSRLRAL
jgi:hypothetical protein